MFSAFEKAQPDAILGLTEDFKKDPNPNKVNLTIGVYKDPNGATPVLPSVHEAEKRLLTAETTKSYLAIDGSPEYARAVQTLMFGADSPIVTGKRAATAHTPGGTGALRVAADFLAAMVKPGAVWVTDPTWPNHPSIFEAAGLTVKTVPYFDAKANALAFEALTAALQAIPAGDVVLLHGCCHNPTGIDPTAEQWTTLATILAERKLLPMLDFAYQGFGDGLEEDAVGLRAIAAKCPEFLVATSYSKNFGLYNERVGALTLVAETAEAAETAQGHVKRVIRANYSNPPAHGALIVTTILGDPALRAQWEAELKGMRDRINGMRREFVAKLKARGVDQDFSFIERQKGMFSFSGLTKDHVKALKERFGLYIVGSGRINVAGLTDGNIEGACDAIAAVVKG